MCTCCERARRQRSSPARSAASCGGGRREDGSCAALQAHRRSPRHRAARRAPAEQRRQRRGCPAPSVRREVISNEPPRLCMALVGPARVTLLSTWVMMLGVRTMRRHQTQQRYVALTRRQSDISEFLEIWRVLTCSLMRCSVSKPSGSSSSRPSNMGRASNAMSAGATRAPDAV